MILMSKNTEGVTALLLFIISLITVAILLFKPEKSKIDIENEKYEKRVKQFLIKYNKDYEEYEKEQQKMLNEGRWK